MDCKGHAVAGGRAQSHHDVYSVGACCWGGIVRIQVHLHDNECVKASESIIRSYSHAPWSVRRMG